MKRAGRPELTVVLGVSTDKICCDSLLKLLTEIIILGSIFNPIETATRAGNDGCVDLVFRVRRGTQDHRIPQVFVDPEDFGAYGLTGAARLTLIHVYVNGSCHKNRELFLQF